MSWQSRSWNLVLVISMLVMGAIFVAMAVDAAEYPVLGVAYGIVGLLFVAGAGRAFMLGVSARPRGIVVRSFWRTRTIPWGEVEKIAQGGVGPGMGGAAGATCPVVVRRNPDGSTTTVELEPLGGYGVSRQRPTPAERAVAGLNQYLDRWREQHS